MLKLNKSSCLVDLVKHLSNIVAAPKKNKNRQVKLGVLAIYAVY
jgi:hypothetical protein